MTDSPNDPAGPTDPADPDASESAHRHPVRRLARALVSPDSYGSVLLLILFTYLFSVGVTASWAASLVITVQIGTVWAVLHVSRARRSVRRAAAVLLVISAIAAAINLFVGKETTGEGAVAFMSAVLYLIAPCAFFGPAAGDGKFPQDLFFSFTTLTTTGYGNLVPAGNPGQTFAVAQMLIGQLFLVTAVAKVINSYTPLRGPVSGSQQTGGQPSGKSPAGESPAGEAP